MELKNVHKSLVYLFIVYIVALLYGMNFILSNLSFGMLTSDFWLLALIIVLPILFLLLRFFRYSIGFLEDKVKLLRYLFMIFAAIAIVVILFFIVPISY